MLLMSKIEHGEVAGKGHRQSWLTSSRSCRQVTTARKSKSDREQSR